MERRFAERDASSNWTGFAPNLVFASVGTGLALYLLFGARGLIALLFDIRQLGRDKEAPREENGGDSVSVRPEN